MENRCIFMYNYIGDYMEVFIERLDNFGRGICFIDDKICFVPNALPGENVEIDIVRSNRKFYEAEVINYITKSSDRINPTCPYFSICGGCQFLNMNIDKENDFKTMKVKHLMEKIGNIDSDKVLDCISLNEFNYRNKVTLHVQDKKLGFYKEKTNELIEIDNCSLLRNEINDALPIIKNIVSNPKNDIIEVMIRCGNREDSFMIDFTGLVTDLTGLDKYFNNIYINGVCSNKKFISDIGNLRYYVSPKSFFQVNGDVVVPLYNEVLDYCTSNNCRNVLDLYCGAGTISLYIADVVDSVLGIDSCSDAIDNANDNKKLNVVDNVEFICSKVEDYIDKLVDNYDLVVVDPPRSGLDNKTIDYLKKINSKSIIYISCDPATLARDLNLLKDKYNIIKIQPYNMFPKTYHCESVTVLERR